MQGASVFHVSDDATPLVLKWKESQICRLVNDPGLHRD